MKKKKINLQIADEYMRDAAEDLAKRIDFSVLAQLLEESGWIQVKVYDADTREVEEWAKENIKEGYHHYDDEYIFQSDRDAVWFKLRWATGVD